MEKNLHDLEENLNLKIVSSKDYEQEMTKKQKELEDEEKFHDQRGADIPSREKALNISESERNKAMLKREDKIFKAETSNVEKQESLESMEKKLRAFENKLSLRMVDMKASEEEMSKNQDKLEQEKNDLEDKGASLLSRERLSIRVKVKEMKQC